MLRKQKKSASFLYIGPSTLRKREKSTPFLYLEHAYVKKAEKFDDLS